MSGLKYAMALLGAGGATAMASEAAAATWTPVAALSPYDAPVDIAIFDGSPAQFYYGSGQIKTNSVVLGTYGSSTVGTSMYGFPGTNQTSGEVKLGSIVDESTPSARAAGLVFNGPGADQYIGLTFQETGTKYVGTAHVDVDGYLQSIEYAAAGVPEPASWALMIGGFGLAGVTLRTRRRQAALSA